MQTGCAASSTLSVQKELDFKLLEPGSRYRVHGLLPPPLTASIDSMRRKAASRTIRLDVRKEKHESGQECPAVTGLQRP